MSKGGIFWLILLDCVKTGSKRLEDANKLNRQNGHSEELRDIGSELLNRIPLTLRYLLLLLLHLRFSLHLKLLHNVAMPMAGNWNLVKQTTRMVWMYQLE